MYSGLPLAENFIGKYAGKSILIIGCGKSGIAAAGVLAAAGARLSLYDAKTPDVPQLEAELFFGGEIPPQGRHYDYVVISPGVPPDIPPVINALNDGAILLGDLELACELNKGRFIAITGTNGKTTTTSLVGEIWRAAGIRSEITGNIGIPVVETAIASEEDCDFITEVSSFQLETIQNFRPHIAAFLNLTPDHLDRYGTMAAYGEAKARIFMNQLESDYLVLNADDDGVMSLANHHFAKKVLFSRRTCVTDGAFAENGRVFIARGGEREYLMPASDIFIPGSHNLENALAAVAMADCAGIEAAVIRETLVNFKGVPHRMELIDTIDGVRYVNDSKGTNTDASSKAIDAVGEDIVLIAGGYNKNADFAPFIRSFSGRVRQLILLGETACYIAKTAAACGFESYALAADMEEAVQLAARSAKPGCTVLLSPASASWDMYDNFEQRGDHFRSLVLKLGESSRESDCEI